MTQTELSPAVQTEVEHEVREADDRAFTALALVAMGALLLFAAMILVAGNRMPAGL